MRIFKNQNEGRSELFGDKVEKLADEPYRPSWLEGFARKVAGTHEAEVSRGGLIRNKLLGSHTIDAGGHIGSLRVKAASDTLFGFKDPPAPRVAADSVEEHAFKEEEPLPTSAERMAAHVSSLSSKSGGRGLIRKDSVSIFDKEAFSHIKDAPVVALPVAERQEAQPQSPVNSKDMAASMFDSLASRHASRRYSSSDAGAVTRMFEALKGKKSN
jgi:hypothetical protein